MANNIQDRIVEFLDGPFKETLDEVKGDKEAYQKFFNGILAKYKVKAPSELSPEDKKKFYDEIDAGWDGDNEED